MSSASPPTLDHSFALPAPAGRFYRDRAKALFDLLVALALLPLALPLVLFLALLIRRDGGPAFFGHRRVGQNGVQFHCWKLRTMVPDAEAALKAYLAQNPEAARLWARDFKLREDPRITRLGRFLRRTSLDELPQLFNVLMGEMSLVGPRPVTSPEMEKYQGFEWAYLHLRPGITGAWQISGRNDVTYEERVRMDADYAARLSWPRDLAILLGTARVVLARTGK